MSRLSRFGDYRFIGVRDTMIVYDSDDAAQFEAVQTRVRDDDLVDAKMLQAFAPDTLTEARNRGFKPFKGVARGV